MRLLALLLLTMALPLSAEEISPFEVTKESVTRWFYLDGTVDAIRRGTVAAQTSGRVVRMDVDVNSEVNEGDLLLEISANEQAASVASAKARLRQAETAQREAKRQLQRVAPLAEQKLVSKANLDEAKANVSSATDEVAAAQAALTQARESFGYTKILAPYQGVITERFVNLGETVAPGTKLLSGFSLEALRFEANMPQSALAYPLTADRIEIELPNGERVHPINIVRFNYADSTVHSFRLRLDLPQKLAGIYPGMWLKARFNQGARQAMFVPNSALVRQGELSGVYLKQGDEWQLTLVRIGNQEGERTEILAGLKEGDRIAANALHVIQQVHHE